jgi:adenosylcobyric acid synthase
MLRFFKLFFGSLLRMLYSRRELLLESHTSRPCLGVFPYLRHVALDEEDSVALDCWRPRAEDAPSIAIIQFPRTSNHTDFRLLSWAMWLHRPVARQFDIIILPGSKNTVSVV